MSNAEVKLEEVGDVVDVPLESTPHVDAPVDAPVDKSKVTIEAASTLVRRTVAQFVIMVVFATFYLLLFGGPGIGFGHEVIDFVVQYESWMVYFMGVGGGIMFLMYITDFSYWTGHWKKLKKTLLVIVGLSTACAALVASDRLPGAAIAVYVLVLPGVIWLVKYLFYKQLHPALFGHSVGIALILVALLMAAAWVAWVFANDYIWTRETRLKFNDFVDCAISVAGTTTTTMTTADESTTTTLMTTAATTMAAASGNATMTTAAAVNDDDVPICLAAWMMWAAPLLGAINSFVFGLTGVLLARSFKRNSAKPLDGALKLFMLCLSMSVVVLWVAGAIAGSGLGINGVAQYLIAVTILIVCGAIVSTVGWQRLTEYLASVPLAKKLTASLLTDWFKALFVLFLMPVIPVYLFLSFLNQLVRRCLSFGYTMTDPKERALWLTLAVAIQFKMLKRWRWTSVLQKAMWIGLFYVIVQVGIGLLVTVFLSWINVALQELPLYATTIIFFLIGVVMFLLPPVPGLPVFLTGGILLGKAAEEQFTFFGAIAYGVLVCWICKQFSLLLQQKMIGQGMSGSLYIRKTVGINSITIRAIRRLLRKPGLSMPKVMILIGGPDWPTSVLTGILRLSWIQMQIGTVPILLLIIPMVASGAFLLKVNEGGLWGPVSDVTIAIAALSQIVAILLALYYISETAEANYAELAAEPDDEEVAAVERADAERTALTLARQSFYAEDFPWWMGVLLMLGSFSISIACYILIVGSSSAFLPFSLTDSIEEKLDNNLLNLVLLWGWVVIGLTTFTTLVLIVLGRWTKYRITHLPPGFQVPQSILNQLGIGNAADPGDGAHTNDPHRDGDGDAEADDDDDDATDDATASDGKRKGARPPSVELPGSTRALEAQRDAQHHVKGVTAALTSVATSMLRPDAVAEEEALIAKERRKAKALEKKRIRSLTNSAAPPVVEATEVALEEN